MSLKKMIKFGALAGAATLVLTNPALAAEGDAVATADMTGLGKGIGAGLAAGLAVIGGGLGIGRIGGQAMEGKIGRAHV